MRHVGIVVLALVSLYLVGCSLDPRVEEALVELQWSCFQCLSGQPIGEAPLTIAFLGQFPAEIRDEEILFAFGDGQTAQGRFVTHTFRQPGMYEVTATAQREVGQGLARRIERFVGKLFVLVLAPRKNTFETIIPHELVHLTVLAPRMIALGERAQICLYATTKTFLEALSVQFVESYSLIGEGGEFESLVLRVPRGATLERCVIVRAFRTGEAWVDINVFAASGHVGLRAQGRVAIVIER